VLQVKLLKDFEVKVRVPTVIINGTTRWVDLNILSNLILSNGVQCRFDFEFAVCKRNSSKCIYKSKILEGVDLDLKSYCLLTAASPLTWNVDELPLTDISFQLKALGLYPLTTTLQRVKATLRDVLLENFRGMLMGVNLAGSEFAEPFDICLDGSFPAIEKRVTFFVCVFFCTLWGLSDTAILNCLCLQEIRIPIPLGPCTSCPSQSTACTSGTLT
jgi:hypothetical protein